VVRRFFFQRREKFHTKGTKEEKSTKDYSGKISHKDTKSTKSTKRDYLGRISHKDTKREKGRGKRDFSGRSSHTLNKRTA
jgi:hypothetical protein